MNYNKNNNLLGWLCAIVATIVYVMTAERSTSWWDCGEFIASAYKLQIVHQPGAPLFLMLQNLFSNFAFGDLSKIAFWMNVGSAVSSGLTILFLFWTITALAKKILVPRNGEVSTAQMITIMGAGLVGALGYAFTDTFWYSAVESEVYAMSSLCTAVVFWAILKWEARADEPDADRWLIFIAYVMGLSIGVHLLNLLVIPAMALVIYFRKKDKPDTKGALTSLLIGVIVLGLILWGIIQYLIKFAAFLDLFFVNSLSLPFGSGVTVFAVAVVAVIVYLLYYSVKNNKPLLNTIVLSATFIILGYSSFSMIMVRAKANPTLNNSDPDNVFAFLSYLNREQYGDEPLFKGPYFDSKATELVEGANSYRKDADKYVVAEKSYKYKYDRETVFPRIYSNREGHVQYYREYLNIPEGQQATFSDNLKFFFSYQIGHMYGRYLLWNFAGRQNDQQGHGSFTEGNWISGIKAIDNMHVGGQDVLPESAKQDPSRNTYFFLPLILGILGAFWHFGKNQKDAGVVGLLFFFTGLAIVLYLNQNPLQPRERDYAYAGSFYAFAIWMGLGVVAIADFLTKKVNAKTAASVATVVGLLGAPVILIAQNWDDHDRSEKLIARDLAKNYLESCAPNAILFTYGDNDTYPLWYAQEVENIRPDIRVVNLSLLSADWYMRQMKQKVNEADALPITIDDSKFVKGVRNVMYYQDAQIPGNIDLNLIVQLLTSDNPENQVRIQGEKLENFLPTKNFQLKVDRQAVIANKVVPQAWEGSIADTLTWTYNKNYVSRAELAIMDILANNNWKRPIYFATTVPEDNYMGLDKYLVSEGFALRLMPLATAADAADKRVLVNSEALYNNITKKYTWGNMANSKFLDPESYRMIGLISGTIYGTSVRSLFAEGKNKEAQEVLNSLYNNMPKKVYRMADVYSYAEIIDGLYKVGETQKANEIVTRNLKYMKENLAYYQAIAQSKSLNAEYQNVGFALQALERYKPILSAAKQQKLLQEVETLDASTRQHYLGNSQ